MSESARTPIGQSATWNRGGLANVMVLKPSLRGRVELYSPKGSKLTVLRLVPPPEPDNPSSLTPFRRSPQDGDFGLWLFPIPVVRFYGDSMLSFALEDPRTGSDPQFSPVQKLFDAHKKAETSGHPEIGTWIHYAKRGGRSEYPLLKSFETSWLVTGCIMQHDDKVYPCPKGSGQNDPMIVVMLPNTAAKALMAKLDPGPSGGQPEFTGDPIAYSSGAFITLVQKQYDPFSRTAAAATGGFGAAQSQMTEREQRRTQQEAISYVCYINEQYQMVPGRPDTAIHASSLAPCQQWMAPRTLPLPDVVEYTSERRQVELIVRNFPPALVRYAFENERFWEMVPAADRDRMTRVAQVYGGFSPGMPQQSLGTYAPPQIGYGQPQAGLQAPPPGYPAVAPLPPQYGAPAQVAPLGAPQAGFGQAPQIGFAHPGVVPQQPAPQHYVAPGGYAAPDPHDFSRMLDGSMTPQGGAYGFGAAAPPSQQAPQHIPQSPASVYTPPVVGGAPPQAGYTGFPQAQPPAGHYQQPQQPQASYTGFPQAQQPAGHYQQPQQSQQPQQQQHPGFPTGTVAPQAAAQFGQPVPQFPSGSPAVAPQSAQEPPPRTASPGPANMGAAPLSGAPLPAAATSQEQQAAMAALLQARQVTSQNRGG